MQITHGDKSAAINGLQVSSKVSYSSVPNKRGVLIGGDLIENLIKEGVQNKRAEGKLGNLKIRYKIIFVIPKLKLIHSFSTSI